MLGVDEKVSRSFCSFCFCFFLNLLLLLLLLLLLKMGNSRSQEIQEKEKAISDEIDKEIKLERRTLKNKMNVLLWGKFFLCSHPSS